MLNQDQLVETWDRIKGFITTRDAEISHEEQWGTRRLAYPIRKGQHRFLEGSYHLTRFATERAFNIELENFLKVDDEVLRSLVTTTLPEEELAAQAAAHLQTLSSALPGIRRQDIFLQPQDVVGISALEALASKL